MSTDSEGRYYEANVEIARNAVSVKRWNWVTDTHFDEDLDYVLASDFAALEEHAEKLTLALRGANKYPEECVEGGACTSALAYEELLIEREALRTALVRAVSPHAFNCGYVRHKKEIKMVAVGHCTCGLAAVLAPKVQP